MRYTSIAAAAALTLLSVSASLHGQQASAPVDARSLALLAKGRAAQAAGNLEQARDALESALAVDPRNRDAYVTLGQVAQAQALPGSAVRYYRAALDLDANDVVALKGQGEALVARGAVDRARANLAKIKALCGKAPCADATALAAVIAKGPPVVTAAADIPAAKN
ncbi:MAG: tetratricopeptide repeat protein [Pseudomonadota bacterium]|nr:tetratricopeptide repeat protein [Pseudomonadota bacterium]